jgi:hypothetical protein
MKLVDSQPLLPPQRLCARSTLAPIDKIIPRAVIDLDDGYFLWATDFALLSDTHVHAVAPCVPTGNWRQTYPQAPKPGGGGDRHHLDLGDVRLSVEYLEPAGWMIELDQSIDWKPDARILTHVFADVPVLCSSFQTAVRLAEASVPTPHYLVHWRSVF